MDYRKTYEAWLQNEHFDEAAKNELLQLQHDEVELEDRFYKELEFGTAGLRGKLGIGTNRMNQYIIAKVTQGLANFILAQGDEYVKRGVAIAYDVRHFSKEFANTTALVLTGNGITTYLFEEIRPTPELSYTVRKFKTAAGIVITASHNPKDYSGYKVYWEEGSQISSEMADDITQYIGQVTDFSMIHKADEKEVIQAGLLKIIGKEVDDEYIEKVKGLALREQIDKNISIVYTPLNGTGNIPVRRVLKERGFTNVHVVPEQEHPDPNFTTVGYPNPEDVKAFEYSKNLGKKVDASLLIATDPDCDRMAVMVQNADGEYTALNGNQTGALLLQYIFESKKEIKQLLDNGFIVKSIVTGDLGKTVAKKYGVETYEALTGFKNICGKANELERDGKHIFMFGYEESIGYVTGDFVKDKDGVIASMLIAEAAAYYRTQQKTLLDILEALYLEYGFYSEEGVSLVLEGIEGKNRMDRMMASYRNSYPTEIDKNRLVNYIDYSLGVQIDVISNLKIDIDIPHSNVLKFEFEDGSWYALRPSGTEPKMKVYIYTIGKTKEEAQQKAAAFKERVLEQLHSVK